MHVGDLVLRAFGWKARKFKVLLQVGPVPQAPAVAPDEPGFESWFTCPFPRGPQTCHQSLLSLIVFIHSFVRSFTDVQHHLCTRCHVSMCGGDDRPRRFRPGRGQDNAAFPGKGHMPSVVGFAGRVWFLLHIFFFSFSFYNPLLT